MGWIIFWCILALLMVVLLMPLRIAFSVEGKQWSVSVSYGFFRILRLPKPPEPIEELPVSEESAHAEETDSQPAQEETEPPAEESENAEKEPQEPVVESEDVEEESQGPVEEQTEDTSDAEDILPEDYPDPDCSENADIPEEAAEQEKKPKKKSFFQRLKPSGLSDILALVKDGFASISPPLRLLAHHLHFIKLRVLVNIATEDAAKTAITYGAVSSSAFWLLGQLQTVFDIRPEQFSIRSNFFGTKTDFSVSGELRATPITLLTVVLGIGIRFLVRTWLRFRREDKAQKAHEKAQQSAAQTSAA